MNRRSSEDRLYTAVVLAFLVGLVALGLLGVPALLVAAIGAALAAPAMVLFHRRLDGADTARARRRQAARGAAPATYMPSVLERSTVRRRRGLHFRRHRHA
jgi:hypothetical protein